MSMFEDAFAEGALFVGEGADLVVQGLNGRGGEGDDGAGGVWSPAGAVEEEPAPFRNEANLGAELAGEAKGVAVIGKGEGVSIEKVLDTMLDSWDGWGCI